MVRRLNQMMTMTQIPQKKITDCLSFILSIAEREYEGVNFSDIADWIDSAGSLLNSIYGVNNWRDYENHMQDDGIIASYFDEDYDLPHYLKPDFS